MSQLNLRRTHQSLQARFARLTALGVAVAVACVSLTSYFFTQSSLHAQTDSELLDVAGYAAAPISSDVASMGGLNASALTAANVTIVLVRADGVVTHVPDERVSLNPQTPELAIARTQMGHSTRTMESTDGSHFRVVAVPMEIDSQAYALVLARPMTPLVATLRSLQTMLWTLSLLFVLIAALMGYLSSKTLVRPLKDLSEAVAYVTETDELVPIGNHSDNELGELSRSFDTMMHSLESSRDRQRRLIADAGHELRTPLTSMRTNVELLVADEKTGMLPDGARAEILGDVAAQLGEFTSLVTDLMQLSRDERVTPSRAPLDFSTVVRSAVERARRRGPSLKFAVDLDPLYIIGEPDTLERAVTNLLDNAVKFSPEDGTVYVTLKGDRLTIADEGPGIGDEDLPHIFDRFYRSNKARNTPGTGLGLSIVAHTVEAHGGWVEAEHASTGGAQFTLRLPPAPREALAGYDLNDLL